MSFSAAIYFDQNFFSQTSGITEATCQLQSSLGQIWSPRKFFQLLFLDTDFADVTLACDDGQVVHAHRVVLAFFSPFFKAILSKSSHPSTLVHMQGVNIEQIKQVLKFIYLGSVQIENDQLEAFYETRSRLKIDETDTLSFEMPTGENNEKGEDVALRNAETIKIRESVIVSRSETFDNDTKKRHEKDDLTKRTKVVTIKSEDPSFLSVEDKCVEDKHSIGIELNRFHDTNTEKAIKTENQSNSNSIKTSQAGNETRTPAPKKFKVKSLPLVTRRSTRVSARAAQVLFVELFGKI